MFTQFRVSLARSLRVAAAVVFIAVWLVLPFQTQAVDPLPVALRPDANVGVGFDILPDQQSTATVHLNAPDGWKIVTDADCQTSSKCVDRSGTTIWKRTSATDTQHQWTGYGYGQEDEQGNIVHSEHVVASRTFARFEGKLYTSGSGSGGNGGALPDFKASVADLDLRVDSSNPPRHSGDHWTPYADTSAQGLEEDMAESGLTGGMQLPCLYASSNFPATISSTSNDPSWKVLKVSLKTSWGSSTPSSSLGKLTFVISSPGVAIYRFPPGGGTSDWRITSASSESERTIDVTTTSIDEDFAILTNQDFKDQCGIRGTFQWDSTISGGPDTAVDCVRLEPNTFYVDLSVDSDGTTDDPDYPDVDNDDRGVYEDSVEEEFEGHAILISCVDSNLNSVPDFADGMASGQENSCQSFTRMVLELKNTTGMNLSNCRIRFRYLHNGEAEPDAGSDPAAIPSPTIDPDDVTFPLRYTPAPGKLRIWKKDGPVVRNPANAADGGDYIAIDTPYTCNDLGITNNLALCFVEAVQESLCDESGSEVGDIVVEVSPDGSFDSSTIVKDTVRVSFYPMWTPCPGNEGTGD